MNKEITIYELLGLIKEGQAPEVIKYKQLTYCKEFDGYYTSNELKLKLSIMNDLNERVEIIEEDNKTGYENVEEINYVGCKVEINIIGIKELFNTDSPVVTEHCIDKINQLIRNQKKLIDKVNKLKENK